MTDIVLLMNVSPFNLLSITSLWGKTKRQPKRENGICVNEKEKNKCFSKTQYLTCDSWPTFQVIPPGLITESSFNFHTGPLS